MDSGQEVPTVAESIRDATAQAMREDDSVILFGLGVNDPGRVFGTTSGLVEEFGIERVFETPTAENAMMGVGVGAALGGFRPIITHQRADFFYLALDQLVNSAAKWRFMFGGQFSVPLVIRLIVGRGWGQGPTHSQNLATWLSHVPGLKILYPSNSVNAKSLLLDAVQDDNPVVYIEDRWLHSRRAGSNVTQELKIGEPVLRRTGDDFTIVSFGSMVSEALIAGDILQMNGISVDVIDMGTLLPLNLEAVFLRTARSRRLLLVESGHLRGSFSEAIAGIVGSVHTRSSSLEHLEVLGLPSIPQPTGARASDSLYPTSVSIAEAVAVALGQSITLPEPNETVRDQTPPPAAGAFSPF